MPHTTPKPSRIPGPLHKAGLFVLFAAITAALCLLLNFLLVDDLHAYSRAFPSPLPTAPSSLPAAPTAS